MPKSHFDPPDKPNDSVAELRRRIEEKIDDLDRRLSAEERRLAWREHQKSGQTEDSPAQNEQGGPSEE